MSTLGWNNVVSTLYQRCVTLFQRCFNVGHWRSINVRQRWKPDVWFLFHFQRQINVISTLIQSVETKLIQPWNVRWEAGRWKEKLGAVTTYYLVNTFVDPTHSCFRYSRIIYNKEKIVYHIREAEHLGD